MTVEQKRAWRKSIAHEKLEFSILWVRDHYCGYVKFPRRPVREMGYEGILTYVPVHGGITFAEKDGDGWKYGFDCAHSGDYVDYRLPGLITSPEGHRWTEDEVATETEKMAKGIIFAAKYEKRYLRCITNKGKARIIDKYHKELGAPFDVSDNVGAALNLLCGKL